MGVNNIRKIRENKGLSQEYIAYKLSINQSTYSKIENNQIRLDTIKLKQLASILETTVDNLINTPNTNEEEIIILRTENEILKKENLYLKELINKLTK
jgi:transcriptional regulator with XRE-family HTH domain